MAGIRIEGNTSGAVAEVTGSNQLKVITETNVGANPNNVGALRFFSENDPGDQTGTPSLYSPETDEDYRLRTAIDNMLDSETFNYSAQNTGKHSYSTTTVTATWNPNGLITNGSSITTAGGATVRSYAEFPVFGANVLYAEFEASINALCPSNAIVDWGMFRVGGTQPFAPNDGAFFRLTAAGLQGVVNYNTVDTTTAVFDFIFDLNHKYQFIIAINQQIVQFWVDGVLYGTIQTPNGQGQPFLSATLPVALRHGHTSTAGTIMQFTLTNYNISVGGVNLSRELSELGNAILGSYQGLSGGTMGSLATYANNTNPTAAIPSNTSLTANLLGGLGGQAWETFTSGLAANTDGILMSYQVPAGTIAVQGKRLRIIGVKMSAFIQTVLTGGGFNSIFTLAFGGTAVNLTTAEGTAAKARRIVLLPEFTQAVTSNQAVNTIVSQPGGCISTFDSPIFVDPGQYVQLCVKHIGTVATAGVIAYNIQLVYSWI
jgi:hypothetical protein